MLKAYVKVTPATWARLKAIAATRGIPLQVLLGRLVEREVQAYDRELQKKAARGAHFRRELSKLDKD
jgi:predicted DNA-binding ribbon-helix-helix protein